MVKKVWILFILGCLSFNHDVKSQCFIAKLDYLKHIQPKKSKKSIGENLLLIYGSFVLNEERIDTFLTTEVFTFNDTTLVFSDFQKFEINDFARNKVFLALVKVNNENSIEKSILQFKEQLERYIFYPPALMLSKLNYSLGKNELLDMHLLGSKERSKTNLKFRGKNVLNSAGYELFFELKEVF